MWEIFQITDSLWPGGIGSRLGTEQVVSSIPGSVGYKLYPIFIEPTITWVPSYLGPFGVLWVHMAWHKNCVEKIYI